MINIDRAFKLNDYEITKGPIVYWMSRDQRVNDNWALLLASELSSQYDVPLIVIFCIVSQYEEATLRQYHFMIEGLKEVENRLSKLGIEFKIIIGNPATTIPKFLFEINSGCLISDFDPLKIKRKWKSEVRDKIKTAFYEVDAHNIVPCRHLSDKQEYAAYTIRQKLNQTLPVFLDEFPKLKKKKNPIVNNNDWDNIYKHLKIIKSVKPVAWLKPGETAAKKMLNLFIRDKLQFYHLQKNDPNKDNLSNLSPYLHFGQISAQMAAMEIRNKYTLAEAKEDFLDELIVRRELADNFCYFNENYDDFSGFPDWSRKTLDDHRKDKREFVYSKEEFEQARTHDKLWNAAQKEMLITGKMHGFMRMYWAKKILEWSLSPEDALEIAIYLNDKYELDGRDPNGYTGISWSIGGVHDRALNERYVFGKIRYMSYNNCKSKFDVAAYISKIENRV